MQKEKRNILRKINRQLNAGKYTSINSGLQDTLLVVYPDGNWVTKCINEFGTFWGDVTSGNIKLSESQKEVFAGQNFLEFDKI
jgi:hypothetical protein